MAAPIGNTNARRGREWREAIEWALAHFYEEGALEKVILAKRSLYRIAMNIVHAAAMEHALGDKQPTFKELLALDSTWRFAVEEIGNRLDGRPMQAVAVSGDGEGAPVETKLTVEFIAAKNADSDTGGI